MKYFITAKNLQVIKEMNNLINEEESQSSFVVFYKASDVVKMEDIVLINKFSVDFVEIGDRDDILIYLGGWFVQNEDTVTFLDNTLPVPKMYNERINCLKQKTQTRSRNRTSHKKITVESHITDEPVLTGENDSTNVDSKLSQDDDEKKN